MPTLLLRQVIQDRAIRSLVAMTGPRQIPERLNHSLQVQNLLLHLLNMLYSQILNVTASAAFVAPQAD